MKRHRPDAAMPGSDLEVVILDYNGVIGRQPTPQMWERLAALAGWPPEQTSDFENGFWARREPYDAGELTTHSFWSGLLRGGLTAPPGSALLDTLRQTDTDMWTHTDPAVVSVLRATHAAGTRLLLLSNAPHPLADALDRTPWCSTLMSKALFSARLGINKPSPRAFEAALAAAGSPRPEMTLFVDDRHDNCAAASQLGMQALHFDGDPNTLARRLPQPLPLAPPVAVFRDSQMPALAAATAAPRPAAG
ncbi:HAD-IA family hydrolase [Streptomyces sp. CA-106131]|uniref:HAD-IA family hydrolase n=1 Tax=Streptomyces sp. CA-106131 TaxID=3240045 RepID=UPI003D8F697C